MGGSAVLEGLSLCLAPAGLPQGQQLPPRANGAVPEVPWSCMGRVLAPGKSALPVAEGTDGSDDL